MPTARRTASWAASSVLTPGPSCFVEIVPPNRSVMVHIGHLLYSRLSAGTDSTRALLVSIAAADFDSPFDILLPTGSSKMVMRARRHR
jgi:hypothetical protein